MWGQCHGLTLLSPRNVAVQSLDQVFACFGMPQIMFRPVRLGEFVVNACKMVNFIRIMVYLKSLILKRSRIWKINRDNL